jgi:hypothetical protein
MSSINADESFSKGKKQHFCSPAGVNLPSTSRSINIKMVIYDAARLGLPKFLKAIAARKS